MSVRSFAISTRSRPGSSTCETRLCRPSSASRRRSAPPRSTSSARYVATSSTGLSWRLRVRKSITSMLAESAHCRSSKTSTTDRPRGQRLDALQQGLEHLRLDQPARGRRVGVSLDRSRQPEGSLREAEHPCDVTGRQLACDVSQHANNGTVGKSATLSRRACADRDDAAAARVPARRIPRSGGTFPCRHRRRA